MRHNQRAFKGTFRQLQILLAVYEHSSVKAASELLFLSQPTISMQLKKLSDIVDMPLYHVVGRRLVFTKPGLELVATAKEVMSSFSRLDMNLANLRGLKAGQLNLAVVTTSKYVIPHILGPFCQRYPDIDVQLNVGNRGDIIERLKVGSDDFYVFSHPPEDVDLEQIEFLTNPLVAIAHQGHPLAQKRKITLSDIASEAFIMREPGSGTRYAIERFLQERNATLNVRMTIESNEAIKHAVMSNLGISIVSAHTLVYGGQAGLVQLPIEGLPIKTHWYFCWQKAMRPSLIAAEFLRHVETEGRQMLIKELKRTGIKSRDID